MTKESSIKVASWAIPLILGAIFAIAAARVQLDGKEDKATHDADLSTVRSEFAVQQVRAEARAARTEAMLRDLVCPANPQKDYCK